jgi:hypothetical protein
MAHSGEIQIYGTIKFALYGPDKTDWLNRIRSIHVSNDIGGWQYSAEGEIQPYENIRSYQKRTVTDRLTPEMLESYCGALGIDLFNADFYGSQSLLTHTKRTNSPNPSMSLAEARSHIHI